MAAQAALEAIAERIRHSDDLLRLIRLLPPQQLQEAFAKHPEGRLVLAVLDAYVDQFGHQIYNLDFAQPTQAENLLPVLLSLKALVDRPGDDAQARQQQLATDSRRLVETTARSFDPLRRRLFATVERWAKRFGPYREEALFYMGAGWPTLRGLAREVGRRCVAVGALDSADDVFYLESVEIGSALSADCPDDVRRGMAKLARTRRELREARKRLHIPPAVPPSRGLRFGPLNLGGFETQRRNAKSGTILRGFAVSPGRVTASASVILSPSDFAHMQPDSILVCPTTTPAWTPLFAQARGLVTDVGGILAHGSIVAREYGIPAVMGVGNGTQRIAHGQLITVDGDLGNVDLTPSEASARAPR
jgi:phosphohistidine swiveling domain-containing protein